MRAQLIASIVGLTLVMGSSALAQAAVSDIPTVTTEEDVVRACTQAGNEAECKTTVLRYVAYLKASGKRPAEINTMIANTVLALAQDSALLSSDVRAEIANTLQILAAGVTDPREALQVAAISQSVLNGSYVNRTTIDNGTAASPA